MNKSATQILQQDGSKKAIGYAYIIGYILGIILIIYVISKAYSAYKSGLNAAGDIVGQQIITQQTGVVAARQSVCKAVAEDVRAAITCVPFTNYILYANSDSVATALNRLLSTEEASLTSTYFKQNNGVSLLSQLNDLDAGKDDLMSRINEKVRAGLS